MKKHITSFLFLFCVLSGIQAADVALLRIGESSPATGCYRMSGEQLSGGSFQQDALLTYNGYQYTVYYNATRNVCIARRKLPFGAWQEVVLSYRNTEDDSHNVISMGICKNDGTIHLSYDHHNDDLHYCYSIQDLANDPENKPWTADSFSETTDVMDKAVPNVTYPRFISMPDGNMLFECRFRWSGYGDSYLRKYDGHTHTWTRIGRYVQGEDVTPDACAYINRMDYDVNGRLHVSWCWRDDFGGGSNHDLYYGYSDDDGYTWHDKTGTETYATEDMDPVYSNTTGTCMGQTKNALMLKEIPYNKGYINQESQTSDSKGRVHILSSYMDGDATESNWTASRTKCILHHHYLDTDGTLVHRYVKNGNSYVNSSRRSQIVLDKFDNAYVVANGAQLYTATAANDYNDWDLASAVDDGRFCSEVQMDHTILADGVLSFVFLETATGKWTVIDYLIDNPHTPDGAGLTAEYFSDAAFETLVNTETDVQVGKGTVPENTQSIRYSGTFETSYAENYTLYLTTAAETTVYIDDLPVLITKVSETAQEHAFTFSPIASHKHNIIIESVGKPESLKWESTRTGKQEIPLQALYADKKNAPNKPFEGLEPDLPVKVELENVLAENITVETASDKSVKLIEPFNPLGDYTVEVKCRIQASEGRGLDIEARSRTGKGFRISLNENTVASSADLSELQQLAINDNMQMQVFRFVVSGEKVYVFCEKELTAICDLADIKEIQADDTESAVAGTYGEDVIGTWSGSGKPTEYGWSATSSSVPWNTANGGSGVRYQDASGHSYEDGTTYDGQLLTIRWDNNAYADATYFYPVTLEANTTYSFDFVYEYWGSASTAQTLTVGVARNMAADDVYKSQSYATASLAQKLRSGNFMFSTMEAGTYYLTFSGTWAMFGIGRLSLKSYVIEPVLRIGKNYNGGSLAAEIAYVSYQDNAYLPGDSDTPEYRPVLPEKAILRDELLVDEDISVVSGNKHVGLMNIDPTGDYSVEVSARMLSGSGRGLDVEARNRAGKGFRTSLSMDALNWIAPYSATALLSPVSGQESVVVRYAVIRDTVHIYVDGEYVHSCQLARIGNMNETGMEELADTVDIHASSNLIGNPDFRQTADDAAPAGWVGNGTIGGGTNARVQIANAEMPGTDPTRAAFVIRFDNDEQYGTYFAYPVVLQPNTSYLLSYDLIAWGTNTDKTFITALAFSADASSGVLLEELVTTPSVRATMEMQAFYFTTPANLSGTMYLVFKKQSGMGSAGITNIYLGEYAGNHLLYGKNYTVGDAEIFIDYITYDPTGAYAPVTSSTTTLLPVQHNSIKLHTETGVLHINSEADILSLNVYDALGRCYADCKSVGKQCDVRLPQGIFLVRIQTDSDTCTRKIIMN